MIKAVALIAVAGLSTASFGDILAQVGSAGFDTITNSEDFQSYGDFDFPSDPFDTASGFHLGGSTGGLVIWGGDGALGFPTRSLYQNGGSNAMMYITLTSGANLPAIQLDIGNGFGANPQNVWVRAYNNGSPVADFDFDGLPIAGTLSVYATGGSQFDELRVQSYGSNANNHNESDFGAIAIDNIKVGTIPAPGAFALLGLGGLAAARRRRA